MSSIAIQYNEKKTDSVYTHIIDYISVFVFFLKVELSHLKAEIYEYIGI